MKNALSKITLFVGIVVVAATTNQALSQNCNSFYGGVDSYYYQSAPQLSRSYSADYHGDYYAPQATQVYGSQPQIDYHCAETSHVDYSHQSSTNERLKYIEMVLAYIVNFLGLNDNLDQSHSANPQIAPQSTQPNCAGGT